jgi:hypothetical protein
MKRKLSITSCSKPGMQPVKGGTIKAITEKVICLKALILPLKALVFGRH